VSFNKYDRYRYIYIKFCPRPEEKIIFLVFEATYCHAVCALSSLVLLASLKNDTIVRHHYSTPVDRESPVLKVPLANRTGHNQLLKDSA
jgi:hypothetical protein